LEGLARHCFGTISNMPCQIKSQPQQDTRLSASYSKVRQGKVTLPYIIIEYAPKGISAGARKKPETIPG
jgi:hypothetical protein